jgi:hypothetical protein
MPANLAQNGRTVARKIISDVGSRDVFIIAAAHGLTIRYASWFPVTLGEFERELKVITVNRTEIVPVGRRPSEPEVIAHELGHFFAGGSCPDKIAEEQFAHEFASVLIGETQVD